MANWAIVIGVNKYVNPRHRLRAPVKDALRMREWLLDEERGNVPLRNLTLLLSPNDDDPPTSPSLSDISWSTADTDSIIDAIESTLQRSNGEGERFYFYFSGHGLTVRMDGSNQEAILPSNFREVQTTNSFTVRSLFELFKSQQFHEQYFFVDACRNIPFETEKRVSPYPTPRLPLTPPSPQFVMFATQPGVKAIEILQPGDEQGAFSAILCDGLNGKGAAKAWDDESGEYVVQWNGLFQYVEAELKALKIQADAIPGGPLIQIPRQYGEKGSQNPILGRFAENEFEKELLSITLKPENILSTVQVKVRAAFSEEKQVPSPITNLPIEIWLTPRTYAVEGEVVGYERRGRIKKVDLYSSMNVKLEFIEKPPEIPFAVPASRGEKHDITQRPIDPRRSGSIRVNTADKLARLEIASESGQLLGVGRGSLALDNVKPGFYRVRVVSPEGEETEELIELLPGDEEKIDGLKVPFSRTPAMQWAIAQANFFCRDDGTVEPSESIGPAAYLKLSTILTLAAGAGLEDLSGYGHKLRSLQIPSFSQIASSGCSSGVQVLLGDELEFQSRGDRSLWTEAKLRCWPIDEPAPIIREDVVTHGDAPAVAYCAACRQPGPYWLSIHVADVLAITLPIVVLQNWVTMIVLTREPSCTFEVHQYLVALGTEAGRGLHIPNFKFRDPEYSRSHFAVLRRIELMQRLVLAGRMTPTEPDIDMLLFDKWADPIAGCLGGYLLVRLGRTAELSVPSRNLANYFPELPDSHLLEGLYLEHTNELSRADTAYRTALDRGLPIYRDGLTLLDDAVRRHSIEHPRVALLRATLAVSSLGSLFSGSSGIPDEWLVLQGIKDSILIEALLH